jgi:hypothetical protein
MRNANLDNDNEEGKWQVLNASLNGIKLSVNSKIPNGKKYRQQKSVLSEQLQNRR